MGSYFSCSFSCFKSKKYDQVIQTPDLIIKKVAIKFPNGNYGIEYNDNLKLFTKCSDIDLWLMNIYSRKTFSSWILYNDDTEKLGNNHTRKGHCKGIVAWNDKRISWLCHSAPNFPRYFEGNSISKIEHGELIYGQSFQYIEIDYSETMIIDIIKQIHFMEANIFVEKNNSFKINPLNIDNQNISVLKISENITHLAKSPHHEIDIYGTYIGKMYPYHWKVETWLRGHLITDSPSNISDVKNMKFDNFTYSEKHDHSKIAVSDNSYYWIGDLNRMTSQYKRGGGGFICNDEDLSNALNKLMIN